MVENDLIEAIVALPGDLFYNTGISIYVFVLSKNKRPERKGKIQLINAVNYCKSLSKSLGKKRKEITPEQIETIVNIYKDFDMYLDNPTSECKVFDNSEFLYKEYAIYQPLQRSCYLTEEYISKLENSSLFLNDIYNETSFIELQETNPRDSKQEKKYNGYIIGKEFCSKVLAILRENITEAVENDYLKFQIKIKNLIKDINGYTEGRLNSICVELSKVDKNAIIQKKKVKGKSVVLLDNTTKDTEIVRLSESIDEYMEREVYPYVSDAIYVYEYDPNKKGSKEKKGAEFPFTRYFYEYKEPEKSDVLLKEFHDLEEEINEIIKKI